MIHNASFQKWFFLVVLSLIWGSSYILIKIGLTGYGYLEGATIRLVAAGIVFLPLGLYYFTKIPLKKFPLVVLSSLLSMFLPAYLLSLSQQHVQSSVTGILIAMTPSFTFLVSVFFFKKSYSAIQFAGLALGLLCCVVLSVVSSGGLGANLNIYVFLIITATLCYGLNINLVKHYLADVPSLGLSAVSVSINGILAFIFVYMPRYDQVQFVESNAIALIALLGLGIFGTALAQLINNKLITLSSPLFASAITYTIPVIAILWGLLDEEPLTMLHFVVIMGILASVYMIRKEKAV